MLKCSGRGDCLGCTHFSYGHSRSLAVIRLWTRSVGCVIKEAETAFVEGANFGVVEDCPDIARWPLELKPIPALISVNEE